MLNPSAIIFNDFVIGPEAADRFELLDMSKQQTLLEQIIQQAQHFFMRRRTEYVLDTIAKEVIVESLSRLFNYFFL